MTLFTRLLKWLAELKPQAIAISVNDRALWQISACALTIRRCITYWCGAMFIDCRNIRAK
mgnify:CR=1 FL=1